jgi:hypothetical protein
MANEKDNASGPSVIPISLVKVREEKREGEPAKVGEALQFIREVLANENPAGITVTVYRGPGNFYSQNFGVVETFTEIVASVFRIADAVEFTKENMS